MFMQSYCAPHGTKEIFVTPWNLLEPRAHCYTGEPHGTRGAIVTLHNQQSCWTLSPAPARGRHGRTSNLGASGIPLWDPWHTLQGSGVPGSSKEKMFLPLEAKLLRRGRKPSGTRSYSDISLPAVVTSPMVVLAGGLGTKSGEGLWLGAALAKERHCERNRAGKERQKRKEDTNTVS